MKNASWIESSLIVLGTLLAAGCASGGGRPFEPLPFHVAVMPVAVEIAQIASPIEEGSATDVVLSFTDEDLADELLAELEDTFSRVTQLSPLPADGSASANRDAWLREAHDRGADLVLEATLSYQEDIFTSLNDRFWLNLPLYVIGGPFCWFVADRSYHFDVRLRADFLDVMATLDETYSETDSQVLRCDRQAGEASLNFLRRADGIGAYALGVLIPAGFIASASDEVPGALEAAISEELAALLSRSLRERSNEVVRGKLVDFYPDDLQVTSSGEGRCLEGEFILEIGRVSELGACGYRFGETRGFTETQWTEVTLQPPEGRRKGLRRYRFQIPLDDSEGADDTVQLQVRQLDRAGLSSARTFTYLVRPGTEQAQASR
jgi:hypothetical protein